MRLREVRLGPFDLELEHRPDGTIRARSPHSLGNYPSRLTERLEHWAEHAPGARFSKRGPDGAWRRLTYAETLEGVRRIGQALLERGLSAEARSRSSRATISSTRCSRSPPSTSGFLRSDLARLLAGLAGFRQAA